jgi:metal transporter CNNM
MLNYLIVIILLIFSALFSGLTLGLMSLSAPELKRKVALGDKDAKKVYPVRKQGNLLLTTLLIGNVAINAALSIFLGSIASGLTAGLTATALIVVFGEITPQAVFSRFALSLGAKTAWLVRIFIIILYPISWPIAWVLNKTLGEEMVTIYSKQELMKIVEEHKATKASDVDVDEERIVKGALTFSDKLVKDVMTPRSVIKAFESSQKIDRKLLNLLSKSDHSRFPIYKEKLDNVIGILYLTKLVGEKSIAKSIGRFADKKVLFVDENKKLNLVFNAFLNSHQHMFIVTNEFGSVVGLITLENILEEIIKLEIIDEFDKHQDLRKFAKKKKQKRKKAV